MAESLHCPPETITTLLTGNTPVKNKKLPKKNLGPLFKNQKITNQKCCRKSNFLPTTLKINHPWKLFQYLVL